MSQYNAAAAACTEMSICETPASPALKLRAVRCPKGQVPKEKFLGATTTAVAWAAMTWLNVAAAAAAAIHPGTPQLALEI